jgi:UDP-N-acetyl-D-mannosaminuronate dehydrogenase
VCFHDPYVADWTAPGLDVEPVPDLEEAVMKADITVLLQSHGGYDLELLGRLAQLMLDTRGTMTDRPTVERL